MRTRRLKFVRDDITFGVMLGLMAPLSTHFTKPEYFSETLTGASLASLVALGLLSRSKDFRFFNAAISFVAAYALAGSCVAYEAGLINAQTFEALIP